MASAIVAVAETEEANEEDGPGAGARRQGRRRVWDDVHTLSYRVAEEADASQSALEDSNAVPSVSSRSGLPVAFDKLSEGPLGDLLVAGLPEDFKARQQCKETLEVLQMLEKLNRLGPRLSAAFAADSDGLPSNASTLLLHGHIPRECFLSSKLSPKLSQQLKDVLAICGSCLPAWCKQLVFQCKFLFPLEVRRRFFYSTALGMGRALQHMQQLHAAEVGGAPAADRELRVGRLQRQKVRVSRKRILESAIKVMELYAKQRAVLELEYFDEAGTGLGPTLEFYTLLSHELQKRSLGLWRHEDASTASGDGAATAVADSDGDASAPDNTIGVLQMEVDSGAGAVAEGNPPAGTSKRHGMERPAAGMALAATDLWHDSKEYVNAPFGLFPASLAEGERGADSKVAAMGRPVNLYDVSSFDPQLGSVLERLTASLRVHKAAGAKSRTPATLDGVPVEDLSLTFTLPGSPDYLLCPGGDDKCVDSSNLEEYISAVVDALLGSGIEAQLAAFREGFNEVFPLQSLECFYEDELEALLCGAGEMWTIASLADSIKFDHGYNSSSPAVKYFLEILAELDSDEQRRFLRFVTGCPRLPPGGLSALQPRLTVVRKHPSSGHDVDGAGASDVAGSSAGATPVGSFKDGTMPTTLADGDLPSVMTCANYIKLPPYSSKQIMKERLMFAVNEGQGSFDLS
eukprot:gene7521-668_t